MRSRIDSTRESPLRNVRQSVNAPSGSSSAHTTAPVQPSTGSYCIAIAALPTDFHRTPDRSSVCASRGGAGSGKTSSSSFNVPTLSRYLQRPEITRDLEWCDVGLVVGPLSPFVDQEVLEHMGAERLGHQRGMLHRVERVAQGAGQRPDANGQAFLFGERVDVVGGLAGELVALFDALQTGCEDQREREIRVARRVGGAELDAG